MQDGLKALILTKMAAFPTFYPPSLDYWAGAHVVSGGDGDWAWDGHHLPMEGGDQFWRGGVPGSGCPDLDCKAAQHAMFLKTNAGLEWRAGEQGERKGFLCAARCRRGYRWYAGVGKCARVVPAGAGGAAARGVAAAAADCAATGGRLYSAADCAELAALREEMRSAEKEVADGAEFFLGTTALADADAVAGRRRSAQGVDAQIDA